MDQSVGKIPGSDGSDYSYWKIRMLAFLQSQHSSVWDIYHRADFKVLEERVTQLQQWEHEANNKSRNFLLTALSRSEFNRVSHLKTAHEIWTSLANFHEGTSQVMASLYETYK